MRLCIKACKHIWYLISYDLATLGQLNATKVLHMPVMRWQPCILLAVADMQAIVSLSDA